MIMRLLLCVFFTLYLTFAAAQYDMICHISDAGARYREHNTDFKHLLLDIKFDTKTSTVYGKETITFAPIRPSIDSLYLDAPDIKIKSIVFAENNLAIPFQTYKDGVTLFFKQKHLVWQQDKTIIINYETQPAKGLYFIGWNDSTGRSRKQIWTQGQGIDNRHWFPCFDDVADKCITETMITFDTAFTVISNGDLINKISNTDNTFTWHYKMPFEHVPYLVMIGIDRYAKKDYVSKNNVTSAQYYYADMPQVEAQTYSYSGIMMDWMENEFGVTYPWHIYRNVPVQDFMYGAMENTTATIYGDFYQLDNRAGIEMPYVATNAHELTHQWFGDYITEWSAAHHWLHESFATYYAKMFTKDVWGNELYDWKKRGEAISAMYADDRDNYPVAHSRGGSNRHYPKGSFVIGMLRYVVGDSVYKNTIQQYLKKHAFKNVDTHDFWLSFFENSGQNLDWFFEEWITHSGYPIYTVSTEKNKKETIFYINQQCNNGDSILFKMPVILEVHYTDGTKDSTTVWISKANDTISIPKGQKKEVSHSLFDPGYQILKKLNFEKHYSEKINQALHAKSILDRYDALTALRNTSIEVKKEDLYKIYANEKYYILKNEVLSQLKSVCNTETVFFKKALNDNDFLVRREALQNISLPLPKEYLPDIENMLQDTSYINIELALTKLIQNDDGRQAVYFEKTKDIRGISNNVRIAWLALQLKQEYNIKYIAELTDLCSESYEFRTRVKAFETLDALGYYAPSFYKNAIQALSASNGRLSNPAFNSIKKLITKKTQFAALEKEITMRYFTDWQKERINSYLNKIMADIKE